MNSKQKQLNRTRRHKRVRARIVGTKERLRVSVFKSNKHIFVQLIDDESRKTILSSKIVSTEKSKISAKGGPASGGKGKKTERATEIGKMLAEKAKTAGINEVVFDRGGYKYHGRIQALADGLRAGGLKF